MAGKKENPNAQYAFIALIVALIAFVSMALVGSAKGLITLTDFTLDEPQLKVVNIVFQVSIVLFVFGLAIYAFMVPNTIRRFFSGRQVRYGSNSLIMIVAFIGIVFAVNYLAFQNPDFLGAPWDLTEDKSNTLAPETLQTLATLPAKVKATAFYSSMDSAGANDVLLKFKTNSNGKFDYEFVNPDTDPLAAREAGITGDGKILLEMGKTKEIASGADESELTKALIRLISPEKRAVYFMQGHGEPALESGGELSYSIAKSTLETKNYTVNTLNLLSTNKIPDDALTIIIAGPKKPLAKEEVALLKKYVDAGGSLLVMENPTILTDFGDSPDPLADYLISDWGIKLDSNIVVDLANTQNQFMAVSWDHSPTHPITQNVSSENYYVILPQARSVSITTEKENIIQTPLIMTTDQSWGETEATTGEALTFSPETDNMGPLNLAIAGENSVTSGRVVVFGNSIFAADNGFDAYGNGNIFVNSVDWAAEQENLINLTVREPKLRTFNPPTNAKLIVMIITTMCALPGLVLIAGVYSWFVRRKRG